MKERLLLATDLDGTLLGDEAALRRFSAWIKPYRHQITLVYATGRTATSIIKQACNGDLERPDYIVGLVGTEVVECNTGKPVGDWTIRNRAGWNATLVRYSLAHFTNLVPQADEFQSDVKVSYILRRANPERIASIASELAAARIEAELIYSCDEFLDVLPKGMNKGAAIAYLAESLKLPVDRVVACGDSGNDLSMFHQGFCGVIVANAWPDLFWGSPRSVYRSLSHFADGVISGVEHWVRKWNET